MFTVHCKVDSSEDSSNDSNSDSEDEHAHIDGPTTSDRRIKVFTVFAADTNKVTPTTSIALYFYFSGRMTIVLSLEYHKINNNS